MNHSARIALFTLAASATLALPVHAGFNFLGGVSIPNGAEILSYDKNSGTLLSTYSSATGQGVQAYTLGATGTLTAGSNINLSNAAFNLADTYSLSSVVIDTQNRDFGVATIIPKANNTTQGKAVFFQVSTGTVLATLNVGYHPDSVTITPDGNRIIIANEGEWSGANPDNPTNTNFTPAAGSISVINLSGVTNTAGIQGLNSSAVTTTTFESANLASGVSIENLRNNRDVPVAATLAGTSRIASGLRYLDIEPEYVSAANDKAYITLQENNAVAVFDYATGKISAIHDLGAANVTMDASDRDGAGVINKSIAALRMPDTVKHFEKGGSTYLVTANEGDFRPDDGDRVTYAAAVTAGLIDPATKTALDALYGGQDSANNNRLGRLQISRIDGDTNGDGKIDRITVAGSRGISIINANTGAVAFDSGSMIENYVFAHDPNTFNINAEDLIVTPGSTLAGIVDSRSRSKGPEVEAVAYGSVNGRDYVFAAAERQNGIFAFDITDLGNVQIVDYFNFVTGNTSTDYIAPESMLFISAADSPTGKALLLVGFEISGSIAVFDLSGLSAIPEPATFAALAGMIALGGAALRRRRRA